MTEFLQGFAVGAALILGSVGATWKIEKLLVGESDAREAAMRGAFGGKASW